MIYKLLAILIATVSGSVHCAAMCGGLSLAVGPDARMQVRYQFSRLASYVLLGGIAGFAGSRVGMTDSIRGWGLAVGSVFSIYLMASGFHLYRHGRPLEGAGILMRVFRKGHERVIRFVNPGPRAIVFGLLTPFLPCGWIFTAVLLAVNAGSASWGMAIFAAVWMGSLPVLVAGPSLLRAGSGRIGARGRRFVAIAMVAAGFFSLAQRFHSMESAEKGSGPETLICR